MGSYSTSKSYATDNRMAVTDDAFALSSSGSNNNVALSGHIFDFAGINSSSNSTVSGSRNGAGTIDARSGGAGININVLDGGAIDKSFDFAAFSLSEMLASIIDQGKQQQETAIYTVDTIGSAIQQASNISAAAAAASAAVEGELQGNNQEFIKKAAVVAVAGALAWWLWKGKK